MAKKLEMCTHLQVIASFPPGLGPGFRRDDGREYPAGLTARVIAIPEGEKQSRKCLSATLPR